ncbi:putative cation/H+ exchanger [Lupinus albus]|uniref:Putative cation/H+ exchanger n=1 Tax=Lupinus albus TaxID=3870 RepID=A0A6A4P9Q5_LUPAL|nr:putative cation/H+ exchanger [Lupinus albus]
MTTNIKPNTKLYIMLYGCLIIYIYILYIEHEQTRIKFIVCLTQLSYINIRYYLGQQLLHAFIWSQHKTNGGVIFGPSLLGHIKELSDSLFPAKGSTTIDTSAAFGVMYFFFTAGVKMDPTTLLKTEIKGVTIGLSVFLFTLTIPTTMSILMVKYVPMNKSLAKSLPFIATSQSITAFIVIAIFLRELQILNTDLGRLAISTAMFGDMVGFALHVILVPFVFQIKGGHIGRLIFQITSAAALFFCHFLCSKTNAIKDLKAFS